jgi:murein DD-endopeptidase MepM/ murein hydrolase activator NlpD
MEKSLPLDKVLTSADKAFTSIGRFVLTRPLLSSVAVLLALTITIINNNSWDAEPHHQSAAFTATDTAPATPQPAAAVTATTLPTTAPAADSTSQATEPQWQTAQVKAGESLSTLFKRNDLSNKDLMAILKLPAAKPLHQLKPGEEVRWWKDATTGQLQQLSYTTRKNGVLMITRTSSGFSADKNAKPIASISNAPAATATTASTTSPTVASTAPAGTTSDQPAVSTTSTLAAATISPAVTTTPSATSTPATTTAVATTSTTPQIATTAVPPASAKDAAPPKDPNALNYVSGTIKHSLYSDSRKAGLSSKQANQLVQIFSQKRIAQSLRPGDTFSVLYQNPVINKGKKMSGNIMAAQLNRGGKTYSLIRFVDPKGRSDYYTPQGQSMKDGLVRKPITLAARLTSGFSLNRMDPFLHEVRPHTGVDYAAPVGTPITAAGTGVVKEVIYNVGYGNMVMIDHENNYSTLYAHMSRFAKNLKPGTAVQAGQVIGYVGSTGYSTGPHLHFEIRMNDVPANPLTVALPGASIPKIYRSQFLAQSRILLAQLNTNKKKQTLLAQAKQPTTAEKP